MTACKSRVSVVLATLLLVAPLLLFSGCIEAEIHEAAYYDAKTDSFRLLKVYRHIRVTNDGELNKLVKLAEVRGNLLTPPTFGMLLLGEPSLLRRGESYAAMQIADPKFDNSAIKDEEGIKILNQIKVHPGEFFLTEQQTLACSHQVELPGAAIDQLLAVMNQKIAEHFPGDIDAEMRKRKTDGGACTTLAEVRRKFEQALDAGDDHFKGSPACMPFDDESLIRMKAWAEAKKPFVEREKGVVTITLPLSPADRTEMTKLIAVAASKGADPLRKLILTIDQNSKQVGLPYYDGGLVPRGLSQIADDHRKYLQTEAGEDVLAVRLDFARLMADVNKDRTHLKRAAKQEFINKSKALVGQLKGRGVAIGEKRDAADLFNEFLAAEGDGS